MCSLFNSNFCLEKSITNLLQYRNDLFLAVRCSSQPTWKLGTSIYSNTVWDPDIDEPIFQAVAQYTCPEGYVFEIYQHPIPDPDINFGLIVDETDVLNVTCAPYGLWEPLEVPPCIRKSPISC